MQAVAKGCWFRCVVDLGFEGELLLAEPLAKVWERQPTEGS
jgi:hypothetical protein